MIFKFFEQSILSVHSSRSSKQTFMLACVIHTTMSFVGRRENILKWFSRVSHLLQLPVIVFRRISEQTIAKRSIMPSCVNIQIRCFDVHIYFVQIQKQSKFVLMYRVKLFRPICQNRTTIFSCNVLLVSR